jgi:hypothetical protein
VSASQFVRPISFLNTSVNTGENHGISNSIAGPIAGGVVGGAAVIALAVFAGILIVRRRKDAGKSNTVSTIGPRVDQQILFMLEAQAVVKELLA